MEQVTLVSDMTMDHLIKDIRIIMDKVVLRIIVDNRIKSKVMQINILRILHKCLGNLRLTIPSSKKLERQINLKSILVEIHMKMNRILIKEKQDLNLLMLINYSHRLLLENHQDHNKINKMLKI